jgi:hypothetical protein
MTCARVIIASGAVSARPTRVRQVSCPPLQQSLLDAVGAWAYTQRMRSTRTLVAMVTLLMAAHPTVAADTAGVVVRDAAGEVVGTVVGRAVHAAASSGLSGETMLWVARPIAGMPILLLVGDDALSDTKDLVPLFYESDDCSGSALLDAPAEVDGHAAAVIFDTGVFWPTGRGASRVIRSKGTLVRESTDCTDVLVAPQLCCAAVEGGETRFTAPITGLQLADLHLRMPFRLEQGTAAVE